MGIINILETRLTSEFQYDDVIEELGHQQARKTILSLVFF